METDNQKVDLETAENEFKRFVEEWEIDDDISTMDVESKEDFERLKRRIVRAVMKGRAVIDENGDIIYTLRKSVNDIETLHFKLPYGIAYLSMDRHKDRQNVHKMNGILGNIVSQDPKIFAKMQGPDYKFCLGVVQLFLGS